MNVKPSIREDMCSGPKVFHPEKYVLPSGVAIPWEDVPTHTIIGSVKKCFQVVNILSHALWAAAEDLSNFGEGHLDIYNTYVANAKEKLEKIYEQWS